MIGIRGRRLEKWYVNGPDGLEHGFTLSEPPPGARQQGMHLRLALEVSAGWRAVASEDGKRVTLRGPDDEAVEYGKLVVRDKLGRNIPARLAATGEQVVIEAEDYEAAYPLTIDPLFTLQQRRRTGRRVNVLLPASLRGRGEQTVVLQVNDEATNGVNVRFQ